MKPRRPPLGLVHCGADRVVRVDVDDAGEIVRTVEHSRTGDGTADAVASVLDGLLPARLWVLDERLWTQTLALPSHMVEGLGPEQLARALAFELEPVSGVTAATASVGFVAFPATGDERRIWATTLPAAERDRLAALLAARDVHLEGVAHPAGAGSNGSPSVEVWEQATFCSAGLGHEDGRLVIGASAGQRSWERGLGDWLADAPKNPNTSIEWRGRARPALLPNDPPVEVVDRGPLPSDGDDTAWLARALTTLTGAPGRIPFVAAPARRRVRVGPRAVGVALFVLVLGLIGVDAARSFRQANALEAEIATELGRVGDPGALQRSAASLDTRHQQLARDVATLERRVIALETEWTTQRARLRALLDAAAALRPDELVLEALEPTSSGDLTLIGKSVEQAPIDRFADDLGERLAGDGWKIRPAGIDSRRTDLGAAYFGFRITAVPSPREESP